VRKIILAVRAQAVQWGRDVIYPIEFPFKIMFIKHLKVWKQLAVMSFGSYASNWIDYLAYFLGKMVRLVFFILLIVSVFGHVDSLAGYDENEVLLFFLSFNLMDVLAQALFRGIYLFRDDIRSGNFDFTLEKPINPLFFAMSRLIDILDIIFLFPIIALTVLAITQLPQDISLISWFTAGLYCLISLVLLTSIHILSAAVTVMTAESENLIWLYRESMAIGRFPPEIYSRTLRTVFTYLMPVIIIVAMPVKALIGLLAWQNMLISIIIAILFFSASILAWNQGIKHYSSASS
jgi:ABC-2 type transport system permease protein